MPAKVSRPVPGNPVFKDSGALGGQRMGRALHKEELRKRGPETGRHKAVGRHKEPLGGQGERRD